MFREGYSPWFRIDPQIAHVVEGARSTLLISTTYPEEARHLSLKVTWFFRRFLHHKNVLH